MRNKQVGYFPLPSPESPKGKVAESGTMDFEVDNLLLPLVFTTPPKESYGGEAWSEPPLRVTPSMISEALRQSSYAKRKVASHHHAS